MTLISLVLVLLIEQVRPLPSGNAVHLSLVRYVDSVAKQFNAGERRQGVIAWLLAVVPWFAGVSLVYYLLGLASVLLALAFSVAVLYFLMGFRQFSSGFNGVLEALTLVRRARHLRAGEIGPLTSLIRRKLPSWPSKRG